MDWTVQKAITEFENLSCQAFLKRDGLKVPLFRHPAQLLYSYRFESHGIESALRKAFGQGRLYGFNGNTSSDRVKVGVVAGVAGVTQPILFTNYSRNSTGRGMDIYAIEFLSTDSISDNDYLVREENPEDGLKIWEA